MSESTINKEEVIKIGDKLVLPSWISEIKKFYEENPDIIKPTDILNKLKEYNSLSVTEVTILIWLILSRLIGSDPEKFWVKNSDVKLQVWEPPVYYVWNEKKWLRDERFPVITNDIMEKIYNIVAPQIAKDNIINKKAHLNRSDVDEDFAISFEVNLNFDYNEARKDNNLYYKKPQFEILSQNFDPRKVIWRFRVNMAQSQGEKFFVFRKLEAEIPDFYDLWLEKRFLDFIMYKEGLVLVTWPTWSWKSTTLAAIINEVNKNQHKNVITIEDPIEFVHKNKKSFFSQREVPIDTYSFAAWLKSALREKPDIILVWELRDEETIRLAIEAAETWHLVFATLHTFNAWKTIDRLINTFPKEEQNKIAMSLAGSLVWIISQTLLKRKPKEDWSPAWIIALNEMIKVTEWVRIWIQNANTDTIIQAAWNDPVNCLVMKDHAFSLIKGWHIWITEVLALLYKKDKDNYHQLVSKLKTEQLYDETQDPYSSINILKWWEDYSWDYTNIWKEKKGSIELNLW